MVKTDKNALLAVTATILSSSKSAIDTPRRCRFFLKGKNG